MAKAVSSPILQLIHRVIDDQRGRQLSDQDLLRRFKDQRDEAAFQILLRRHGPMVLDVCRGMLGNEADAEDAFQATFLILARKAASIRKTASLGSWLHGVAYRTALKARAQLATRQKNEARAPARQISEPDDLTWREVRQVLHEELTALAERYRVPLVACYLEGKTQDEAAAQLGLAKSTLKERLERGRSLLRARLVRRGLGPTAVLVATAWPSATASACLPATLVSSTVKAASLFAARQAAATGVISAKVAALTHGVLRTMLLKKLMIVATLWVVSAVLLIGGLVAVAVEAQTPKQSPPPQKADDAQPVEAQQGLKEPTVIKADDKVRAMHWHPDGKLIFTLTAPGQDTDPIDRTELKVWDARSGEVKQTLLVKTRVLHVAVSPSGKTLATAGFKKEGIKVWDLGDLTKPPALLRTLSEELEPTALAISGDGKILAVGTRDGTTHLWDAETGAARTKLEGHIDDVRALSFSPDQKLLATAGTDKTVKVWQLETGKLKQTLYGHDDRVAGVAFSPNSKLVASGSYDRTVRLWDVESGEQKKAFKEQLNPTVRAVAFSPDGKTLASCGIRDEGISEVKLWDVETGKLRQSLSGHSGGATSLAFTSDGKQLAAGGGRTVCVWAVR